MKQLFAAMIAALLAIVPGVATAQRNFTFSANALDVATDGKKYGLTASGSFITDNGTSAGGLTTYALTGVNGGTVTFYNDYNPGDALHVAQIDELLFLPPFFVPPQYIVLAADGSVASADFSFGLSGDPYLVRFQTATQTAFFGIEGALDLNSLSITPQAATAAVPEPAAWALMIVGFGIAGVAMRRRRSVLAIA